MSNSGTNDSLLEKINSPADLKGLSIRDLEGLANEIRQKIIETVSKPGRC
jgi:1-deoxy-D-xylulose-5-phosphate synthase